MINKSILLLFTIVFSFTAFAQDYTKFQIQRATMFSNYIAEELELNESDQKFVYDVMLARVYNSNAKIKSDYGFNKTGIPCFADDSGICIESLDWKPGVFSKRFLNNFKNKELCFRSIFKSIKNSGKQNAYFKTSISLTINKNQNIIFNGKIYGKISEQIKGGFGFGYDPIFIPKNYNKTLAELSTKDKNEISHRSIAVNKLINFLSN